LIACESTWVFRKVGQDYQLLLDAGSVARVERRPAVRKAYRDILTVQHGSAYDRSLRLYGFDGRQYRLKLCFERHYEVTDESRATPSARGQAGMEGIPSTESRCRARAIMSGR
jgi:hypothetical protein